MVGCAVVIPAQGKTGITGMIVDYEQGALVLNAKITARNKSHSAEARSNSDGEYELLLPKGDYDVTVEAPGFKLLKRKKIKVQEKRLFLFNVNLLVKPLSSGY
jgi:hypothetical protein